MSKEMVSTIECREHEEELMEIASNACKILEADHNVSIPNPKILLTIGYVYMKNLVQNLAENKIEGKGSQINFINLFDIGISYRENDDAEKEGNYVPFINPTQVAQNIVAKK